MSVYEEKFCAPKPIVKHISKLHLASRSIYFHRCTFFHFHGWANETAFLEVQFFNCTPGYDHYYDSPLNVIPFSDQGRELLSVESKIILWHGLYNKIYISDFMSALLDGHQWEFFHASFEIYDSLHRIFYRLLLKCVSIWNIDQNVNAWMILKWTGLCSHIYVKKCRSLHKTTLLQRYQW